MAANLLLLHKPVPVIKTLNEFLLRKWFIFVMGGNISGELNLGKNDCAIILRMCSEEIRIQRLSQSALVYLYTQTPFVLFLYVTKREGEDETVLKEATVLISSEGSLLFFPHPFLS